MVAALVAAAAAVAVALISNSSNAADTGRQLRHEDQQARQQAVGAARVLAGQLVTAEVYLQGMLDTGRLFDYDDKYDVQLPQADLKRIASDPRLGVDRWQRIATALSNLDSLGFFVRDKYRRGIRRLGPEETGVFVLQIKTIDNALAALDPLSGTPKIRADPFGAK
jgi:hypothetical protein